MRALGASGGPSGHTGPMSDESQRDVPTGLPDVDDEPGRGEHNELGFFSQDEERAADETPGDEEQAER